MQDFSKYHFKEIKDKETIIMVIHRHWFDILQQFIVPIAMAIIFLGGLFIAPNFAPNLSDSEFANLSNFIKVNIALFIWIYALFLWIDYYFDVWVVTDRRIINIEQKGLFARDVSELNLERIQDVTTEVHGFIPTMFNYGDVYIQTAGEKERFEFSKVPNPYGVKDTIMHLQKSMQREESNELGEMIRKEIHDEIS
jgi:uncharacterized membrane protein YdbT with pleckstrin-like domain